MANQAGQEQRWSALGEQAQLEASRLAPTLPVRAIRPTPSSAPNHLAKSYYDTRWQLVNRTLALVETLTHGRAGVLQRLVTYLTFGGTAAIVNLSMLAFLFHIYSASVLWYWLVASIIAYEVSIIANFIPNDYFTFSHLPGHNRSWQARCVRFHITSLSGVMVTTVISAILFHLLGIQPLVAQAIALIVATAYNFTVHHLFTYAHKKAL